MARAKCDDCKQYRDLAITVFGDKEKGRKGLVEQMSEVKAETEDFKFWKRFVSVSLWVGSVILLIIRSLKGILW